MSLASGSLSFPLNPLCMDSCEVVHEMCVGATTLMIYSGLVRWGGEAMAKSDGKAKVSRMRLRTKQKMEVA